MTGKRIHGDSPKMGDYSDKKEYHRAYQRWYYRNFTRPVRKENRAKGHASRQKFSPYSDFRANNELVFILKSKKNTAEKEKEIAESVEFLDEVPEECADFVGFNESYFLTENSFLK